VGPLSLDQVVLAVKLSHIEPSTMMWTSNDPARKLARDLPELQGPPWPGPCGGANQVVWDNFRGARYQGPEVYSEETKLKIKPGPGRMVARTYIAQLPDTDDKGANRTDSYEACLAVQAPRQTGKPTETYAGLKFGAAKGGYFALLIDAAGRVAVYDAHDAKPSPLLPWQRLDAVKSGAAALNILHIAVKAGAATLFVNGRRLDLPAIDLKAERSAIGLEAASEASRQDTWKFLWVAGTESE
jgi:hypothetical protein